MSDIDSNDLPEKKEDDQIVDRIVQGVLSTHVLGQKIIMEDAFDTYNRFPGAAPAIDLKVKAAFHNGFTEELGNEKIREIEKGVIFGGIAGYSSFIVDNDNVQSINPRVHRVGFIYTKFNLMGEAMEIGIRWDPEETVQGADILVPRAPFSLTGTGDFNGFYPYRTLKGLPGMRGISDLLCLIDVIRSQSKLYQDYTKYGEHQGISHPVVKIENLTDPAREQVNSMMTAPRKDKAVIIDMKDDFYYESPMGNTWDPSFMMEFADKFIARETSINMFQLTGDPMGYLSASQTNINEWFSAVKAFQDYIFPFIQPVLMALGLSEEARFQDPSEPTMEAKYESVKLFREATDGLVGRAAQLQYINNEILGLEGPDELEEIDEAEYNELNNQGDNENDTKPDSSEPKKED